METFVTGSRYPAVTTVSDEIEVSLVRVAHAVAHAVEAGVL